MSNQVRRQTGLGRWFSRLARAAKAAALAALLLAPVAQAQTHPGKVGIGISLDERALGTYVDVTKHTWRYYNISSGAELTTSEIDSQGYPTVDFRKVIMDARPVPEWTGTIDDPQGYRVDVSGTYLCSFNGSATLTLVDGQTGTAVQNQVYNSSTNTTTFEIVVPPPGSHHGVVVIDFTNTKRTSTSATGTGITNLKVMQPGFSLSETDPFKPAFFNALASANFAAIRFMDFVHTNNADNAYPDLTEWSERKKPTDASQDNIPGKNGGACWEYVVQVGNRANKDIWINVPVSASTDYVTKLAQLIRYGSDGVNPYTSAQSNPVHPPLAGHLNVYLESSNEVWNSIFGQYNWNLAQANALGITEHQNHARRTVEIKNIFANVFGTSAINNRIRPVLCTHAPMLEWWLQPMLDYINTNYGAPSNHIYMVARQTYFSPSTIGRRDTVSQLLTKAQQDIDNQNAIDTQNNANRSQWVAKAANYGLAGGAGSYEGGPHFPSGGSTTNLSNQIAANRDPGMGNLLKYNYGTMWADLGATVAMQFTISSGYNRYGCWGLTDDIHNPDRNFKFQAMRDMLGGSGGDTTPPAAPTGLTATAVSASQINLDWADNTESDLNGYNVYRSTTSGGPYTKVNPSLVSTSAHSDTGLAGSTTYYYVVRAVDTSNNESGNSNQANATTQSGGGCTASTMHVSSIVVTSVSVGQGNKKGQAQVTVLDNCGNPVANATVTGNFTGSVTESGRTGVTNSSGVATIQTNGTAKGGVSFTFCVTGITHSSLSYNSGANVETCDSGS